MILEDVINFLKKNPPFQSLDEQSLKKIAGGMSMHFYPKDTAILNQDGPPSESIWIIKKGSVKITMRSEEGEDIVVDYRGVGDNFGFLSLISKERQKTNVIAIDDTICYVLGKEMVLNLLESNPAFSEYFMSYLSRYVDRVYREMHTKSLLYRSADRILITTRAGDIAKKAVTADEDTTIQEAAKIMSGNKVSSLVILNKRSLPVGIVTDKDMRENVIAKGRSLSEPVKNIMTISLIRVDAGDSCFDAVLKMIKYNIHHILVIKEGSLHGIMTNHDLMLLQGMSPLSLAHNVDNQQTVDGLVSISSRMNNLVGLLLKEGTKASSILTIITEINDRLVKKVLEIAEGQCGHPPVPYCWIVFGSEGRKEQLFKTDQDNAIVYADPEDIESEEDVRRYFSRFTTFVRDSLLKIGYPLCTSGHMASNLAWCQPLSVWKDYFRRWMLNPSPESILESMTVVDFRPIYGKLSLAEDMRAFIGTLQYNTYLHYMADMIIKNTPPVGFLKSFVVDKTGEHIREFDLKQKGTIPIVDIVRLFALENRVKETSTFERINSLKIKDPIIKKYADELEHSYEFMLLLRIHHQFNQIMSGIKPDNFINPDNLSTLEKKTIREAFHLISKLQKLITEKYEGLKLA